MIAALNLCTLPNSLNVTMHIECIQLLHKFENTHKIRGSMPVIFENTHGTIKWYVQARQFVIHKLACILIVVL